MESLACVSRIGGLRSHDRCVLWCSRLLVALGPEKFVFDCAVGYLLPGMFYTPDYSLGLTRVDVQRPRLGCALGVEIRHCSLHERGLFGRGGNTPPFSNLASSPNANAPPSNCTFVVVAAAHALPSTTDFIAVVVSLSVYTASYSGVAPNTNLPDTPAGPER
ncbi:hypothetical protein GOBAR_DD12279 [Gossypium barbadense]|nr:hypothetical protein GOBAR_DD12279 [Gossypium barbadense]